MNEAAERRKKAIREKAEAESLNFSPVRKRIAEISSVRKISPQRETEREREMVGGSRGSLLFRCRFFLLMILVSCALPLSPLQLVEGYTTFAGKKAAVRSPFSIALENLQKKIGHEFKDVRILRRAMTHPSFSQASHKALGVAGVHLIQSAVAVRYLSIDPDISSSDLSSKVMKMSDGSACSKDGLALGLEKVVRVAPKTNATSAVCGAYRALYGAITLDSGTVDSAISVFWNNHGGLVSAI